MSAKLKHVFAPAPKTERGKPIHIGVGKIKKQVSKLVYCTGKQVIVRDLHNPLDAWTYEEHKSDTTIARIAPSGFYIASADTSGRVLVWDCVGEDKVIKLDKSSIGTLVDMAFSDDSKRLVVCGTGREKFGEAFFVDGGASVGEISGHSKQINSIDVKQTRPYRVATGGEDFLVGWFEGPPFKFKKSTTEHTRYVNCVRFSPDGSKFVTVGSDKKGVLWDGKEGTKVGELAAAQAHAGSIYACAWNADGTKVVTASADKTLKVWDANGNHLSTFSCFGNDVNDQQVGVVWQDGIIASISLQGTIFLLDENNTQAPKKALLGHNKIISALTYSSSTNKAYTADVSGYVIEWDVTNGDTRSFKGSPHTSQIKQMAISHGKLITVAIDDSVKFSDLGSLEFGESVPLGGQPVGVDAHGDYTVVATSAGLVVLKGNQIVNKQELSYQAASVAVSHDGTQVAVGGKDTKIYVYQLDGGNLKQTRVLEGHRGEVTTLSFSPDGRFLGAGDSNREVKVWQGAEAKTSGWVFHTSRVQSLSWAPDNDHLVTGSVDSAVIVWSVSDPNKRVHQKLAHMGGVRGTVFTGSNSVLSVGEDCAMKLWDITY